MGLGGPHLEEHAIGKSSKQRPPHMSVDPLICVRMSPDGVESRRKRDDEVGSDPRGLRVVPRVRLFDVERRLGSETKRSYFRLSRRARTSPQDFAAEGLRARTRRRRASSRRCALVTGMASGVATRLSHRTSINSSRSSTLSARASLARGVTTVFYSTAASPCGASPPGSRRPSMRSAFFSGRSAWMRRMKGMSSSRTKKITASRRNSST
jgi:hypothetical protein